MSQKRKKPSAEFKTKVVLEVIEGDQTLNQICSKYELVPRCEPRSAKHGVSRPR
ncbi:hypothetical protein [Piscirickettsia salmonis]|uniref:hypothetical protein n=1 Tax=Piscirickettsia salmonis TaxID=1238 RepID=UPI0007D74759|nr:hypothetical protein A0O36_02532 [Piscirickettsiaceae bacterium NZ-RLO1]